jgi:hypothetical protein
LTGLQRDGRSPAGVGTRPTVIVLVAHALACTSAGKAGQKSFDPYEKGAWTYFPKKARFPTLRSGADHAPHFKFQTLVADEWKPFVEARA